MYSVTLPSAATGVHVNVALRAPTAVAVKFFGGDGAKNEQLISFYGMFVKTWRLRLLHYNKCFLLATENDEKKMMVNFSATTNLKT